MANVGLSEKKTVITVLTEGKELANELKRKLHPTITSREACHFLLESIVSSYENALTQLTLLGNGDSSQISLTNLFESPYSIEGSPSSEGSHHNSKDHPQKFKKRKTLPRWSEQVRVCSEKGYEGQLEDGYSWRKYGQKDILGANHPRAYYRCTHRSTQGCLATKQVQRADSDPAIVEVIYRGKHSCRQQRLKQRKEKKDDNASTLSQQTMITNTEQGLKNTSTQETEHFPSLPFPSTPIGSDNAGSTFFTGTSYSSPFRSLETSESYFSLNDFGIGHSLQSPESDFGEIISIPTLFTSFPFGDLDIGVPDDRMEFSSDFLEALDGF